MSGPGDRIRIRYDEIEDVSRHFRTLDGLLPDLFAASAR